MKNISKTKYIQILYFLLLLPVFSFTQGPRWKVFFENMQGPIAVDPYDSDIIYIASRVSGESGFWKTTDGGDTWNKYTDGWGMGDPEYIYINPGNTEEIFVVGGPFVGVEKSTDAGETWARADYGIPTDHHGFSITQITYDSLSGYYYLTDQGAGAYCGVYRSEDGIQWEYLPFSSGCPRSIVVDGENGDIYACTDNRNVWKSTDGGESWENKNNGLPTSPFSAFWHLVKVRNSQTFYVATNNGIYKTTDNGENWFSVNDSLTSQLAFTGGLEISQTDTNTVFAGAVISDVDRQIPAGIYVSRNGGDSWQQFNNGLPDTAANYYTLHTFLDNSTNTLYTSMEPSFETYSINHIYRMSNAVITDISEQQKDYISNNIKLQATPNPFNNQTTLVYSLPVESRMTLKIYDILGREVLTLLDNTITSGEQSIHWNGTNKYGESLPSGVYLARMEMKSNNKTAAEAVTIKLLLIK